MARSPHVAGATIEQRVAQVRGIVAERVIVSTQLDPPLSLRVLAAYSGLSVRKLRDAPGGGSVSTLKF
jgi:hypothetical protein